MRDSEALQVSVKQVTYLDENSAAITEEVVEAMDDVQIIEILVEQTKVLLKVQLDAFRKHLKAKKAIVEDNDDES